MYQKQLCFVRIRTTHARQFCTRAPCLPPLLSEKVAESVAVGIDGQVCQFTEICRHKDTRDLDHGRAFLQKGLRSAAVNARGMPIASCNEKAG
jgi:hypothetical protein